MTIETLLRTTPPPKAPSYAFKGPWDEIEAEIRTPLPQDYKDLVRVYGAGVFRNAFWIHTPGDPTSETRLLPQMYEIQDLFVRNHPHIPMYPQPGGLLTCGTAIDSPYIFWLTRGAVSEWPIVVWDHDAAEEDELETFECDLTDFIAGVLTGSIRPKAFYPPEELADEPAFTPSPT